MTLRFIHFSAANKIGDEHQSGQSSFTSKVIPCITFLCCFLFQNLYGQLPSFLFAKQSTGQQSASASVATDAAGNVYVTGTFYVSASFGGITLTSHGGTDIYVVKYDANGNVIWANEGGGPTTYDGSSAIVIDAAGDVVVTGGYTTSATFGSTNISSTLGSAGFIVKYDPSGNLLLAKSVGAGPGGSSISITSSSTDAAGNIYTTGTFYGTVTLGTTTLIAPGLGDNDAYIAKFDPSGNPLWANKGGSTSTSGDYGWGIITNAAGESYISGYYTANASFSGIPLSNHGSADIFIAKYDASGAILWAKGAGGTNLDEGRALAFDNSGNIYVTGYFLSPSFTFDGYSFTGQGGWDSFLIKLDPMGTILWTNQSSGTASENTTGVAVDINDNSVYILGYFDPSFSTTANFGGTVLTSAGSWDIFLAKYDLSGNFIWALRIGDTSDDLVGRIAVDANKNIYLVGYFTDHTTIGSFSLSNPAQQSSFITKLGMQVPPTITSFTPSSGTVGTTVTITGTNFDSTPANNTVKFNGTTAVVTASTATSITTTVPAAAITGTITVTIGVNTATSASNFTVIPTPTISSFSPSSGAIGTLVTVTTTDFYGNSNSVSFNATVTITGTNFDATLANNTVKFNGVTATVTASTATSITTSVPLGASTGPITVTVAGNTATSTSNFTVLPPPTISYFSPSSGIVGDTVAITVTNVDPTAVNNKVSFNGTNTSATATTPSSIIAIVPDGATTGKITVVFFSVSLTVGMGITIDTVRENTATSATNFTVISPLTISSFSPSSGLIGATITITGTNFDTTPANNTVMFNGTTAVAIASTATSITTRVPAGATTGTITVTIGGNTATSADSFCVTPSSPISINASLCDAGSLTLSVSGGTNGEYIWYTAATGGTAITDEVDSSYTTPSLSATTSYYVAINNGSCESARTKVDAIINTPPSQPTITASGATTFCQGRTVTLSSPGFSSYLWSDGSTVYPRVVSTSDSLSLRVTDANGCQSIPSNPITITVNPLPAAPTVSSTQPIVNGVIVLCTESNETTTLSVPAGFVSYQWSSGSTSSSFTTSQSGSYSATVTDTNGCTSLTSAAISINSTSCISITSETLTTQIEGTVSISLISLIATLKTLDVSSIKVVKQPSSGAVASVDNGELTVDYKGVQFSGTDSVTIQVCDVDGNCKTQEFSIDVIGDIKVYNAVSPNGDGKNEFFHLQYIDVIPSKQQNQMSIYNRWGDEVFSVNDYNNHDRVFNGYSNSGNKLPAGTYFYKISFVGEKPRTGYLELKY